MTDTINKRPTEKMDVMAEQLIRWDLQPRKNFDPEQHEQLVRSVKQHGVLQSLVVRPTEMQYEYEIVCGERRWRAAEAAGVSIPVTVRDLDDREAMELALVENVQRDDLDVFEEAGGYQALIRLGFTVKELAERFKRGERFIYGRLDLLKLGKAEQEAVLDGNISLRVAEGLSRIESDDARMRALGEIVEPSHHTEPLGQAAALRLIKNAYVEPQAAAKEWEKQALKLKKEYPDAEVLAHDNDLNFGQFNSPVVEVSSAPDKWDVVESLRVDEVSIPTWGDIGERYGAKVFILPPAERGGEPVHVVERQPLVDADITQARSSEAIFPKPSADDEDGAAEDTKLAAERAKAEAAEAKRLQGEQLKSLLMAMQRVDMTAEVHGAIAMELADGEGMDLYALYNHLHDTEMMYYNAEDVEVVSKWVSVVMMDMGKAGLLWLVLAERVFFQSYDPELILGWVRLVGLPEDDYSLITKADVGAEGV